MVKRVSFAIPTNWFLVRSQVKAEGTIFLAQEIGIGKDFYTTFMYRTQTGRLFCSKSPLALIHLQPCDLHLNLSRHAYLATSNSLGLDFQHAHIFLKFEIPLKFSALANTLKIINKNSILLTLVLCGLKPILGMFFQTCVAAQNMRSITILCF